MIQGFVLSSRPFIVLGDRTSHGGTVVEASQVTFTHNKPIARVGDQVTCPIPGHGTTVIVEGDPTMILDGKPVARHGDKCACGAVLISSQVVSTVGDGGASNPQAASQAQTDNAAAHGVAPAPRMRIDESTGLFVMDYPSEEQFDHRFALICELTGVPMARQPYRLKIAGKVTEGVTDDEGLTATISTGSQTEEVICEIMGDASHG